MQSSRYSWKNSSLIWESIPSTRIPISSISNAEKVNNALMPTELKNEDDSLDQIRVSGQFLSMYQISIQSSMYPWKNLSLTREMAEFEAVFLLQGFQHLPYPMENMCPKGQRSPKKHCENMMLLTGLGLVVCAQFVPDCKTIFNVYMKKFQSDKRSDRLWGSIPNTRIRTSCISNEE